MPEFNANPTQRAFIESRAEADLFSSRKGEGKSAALCWAIFYHVKLNPGAPWAVIRDTWENLQRTTLREFLYWFPEEEGWGSFNKGERVWKWLHPAMGGGEVWFMGMDQREDAGKIASMPLAGFAMDEPCPAAIESGGIDEFIFTTAMGQLRWPNARWYAAKLAQNNSDELHWTYRRFMDPGTPPYLTEKLKPMQTAGFSVFQPNQPENLKNLPPGYYERQRREYEAMGRLDLVARMVEGKITNQQIGRAMTPEWRDEVHLAPFGLVPVKGQELVLCWDWGHCYSDDTDVLTDQGWKPFPELNGTELMATRNIDTGVIEYQRPTKLVRKPYVGEMVSYSDNTVDFCVTPEHLVPVERDVRGVWISEKVEARWLAARRSHHFRVALSGEWGGSPGNPLGIDDRVFATLMGWVVAEGSVRATDIAIYQEKPSPLADVLAETGMVWTPIVARGKPAGFRTSDLRLRRYLAELGTQAVRRVPRDVLCMRQDALRAFLEAYIAGDGCIRKSGEIKAYTVSEGLAGDLQEIGIKIGLAVRVHERAPAESMMADGRVVRSGRGFDIAFKKALRGYMQGVFTRTRYSGHVYCATVPNGTLWVRRGGKVHCNGNTPSCLITQITPSGGWNFLEAIVGEGVGAYQLIRDNIKPLLKQRYRNFSLWHSGDPSGTNRDQSNTDTSPVQVVLSELGGSWRPGPKDPQDGLPSLRACLSRIGCVRVDKHRARPLWHALRGGWHRNISRHGLVGSPVKDEHSHPAEAACHAAPVLFPHGALRRQAPVKTPAYARYWQSAEGR